MAQLAVEAIALSRGAGAHSEVIPGGTIVGLAGLDGHGQEEFLEILAGRRRPAAGHVAVDDVRVDNIRSATRAGIAYLPRDRRKTGVFPNLSVLDNFAVASLEADRSGPFLNFARRRARYETFRDQLSIVAANPDRSISQLSGGNQQKVLLARMLARNPSVLLLNDPTRGVDIATRHVLYDSFRRLAQQGLTLVALSSEIEEVIALCDPVLVFHEGEISARLTGEQRISKRVVDAMFGHPA
jgi:ribose transport system ATP-binding protein